MITLLEAIEQRHSVRRYLPQPIEPVKVEALNAIIDQCNSASGLRIALILDEPKAFASRLVHYGAFSGVCNYLAMNGPADDPRLDEKIGYYGEKIVLEAQRLQLNTCWVALTFKKNRKVLALRPGEKLRCVISIGYGVTQGAGHKIKPLAKVTRCQGEMPEWFRRGAEAALLAPTAINQQKFCFTLVGENQVRATSRWGFYEIIDLGIAKYHFEVAAGTDNFSWVND